MSRIEPMMRQVWRWSWGLTAGVMLLLALQACDQPRIFSSSEEETRTLKESGAWNVDDAFVQLRISGGIAGVDWRLLIFDNGKIMYFQDYPRQGFVQDRLPADEIGRIRATFIENDFFQLNERYLTEGAADLFFYHVTFREGEQSHAVLADDLAAPPSLKAILDVLRKQIDRLQSLPLQLTLLVPSDTVKSGQPIPLKLRIENQATHPIKITFPNTQQFDFYAVAAEAVQKADLFPLTKLWRWAEGREFLMVIRELNFQGGQVQEMQITWDGRDSSGQPVTGGVWLGAELTGYPGGGTPLKKLVILP